MFAYVFWGRTPPSVDDQQPQLLPQPQSLPLKVLPPQPPQQQSRMMIKRMIHVQPLFPHNVVTSLC